MAKRKRELADPKRFPIVIEVLPGECFELTLERAEKLADDIMCQVMNHRFSNWNNQKAKNDTKA